MKIRETCPICSSEINYRQPAVLMPFIAKRVFGWEKAYIDETWKINDIQNGELNHGCSTFFCDNCDFIFLISANDLSGSPGLFLIFTKLLLINFEI